MKHVSNIVSAEDKVTHRQFRCRCGTETIKRINDNSIVVCQYCKTKYKLSKIKIKKEVM